MNIKSATVRCAQNSIDKLKMHILALSVACVLLLAAARVQCQNICYHIGVDCKWDDDDSDDSDDTGGGWLQAMQESRTMAQGGDLSTAARAQINDYICDCCCDRTPCGLGICPSGACPITQCYARVLGEGFFARVNATIVFVYISCRKSSRWLSRVLS